MEGGRREIKEDNEGRGEGGRKGGEGRGIEEGRGGGGKEGRGGGGKEGRGGGGEEGRGGKECRKRRRVGGG